MATGLDDALLGWLVASVGDAVARRLRGDPARRALGQVVERAVEATVAEVGSHLDGHTAEHLRSSLLIHDASPNRDGVSVTSEAELRRALYAWTAALDRSEFGRPGYLSGLGVDAQLLADTLTSQIAAGIHRNGRAGGALDGLAAWLWRDGVTGHLVRLERKLDATAGTTTESAGGGLPGGTPNFTGRQQALDELAKRVQAHDQAGTVVAIHAVDGMAGVGKTECALRAAHQHKHRYPDGQYFINLHGYTEGIPPLSPEVALAELLHQAGVPSREIPPDQAGRQVRWQARMAARRALVLLDNALDADQVRPLLPGSTGCLVLITSRARLTGLPGASALTLDVLPPREAAELFLRLIGPGRYTDQATATRVVDLVGRLPVAIEAAAGQVHDDLTVTELVDDLTDATRDERIMHDAGGPLGGSVRAAFETSLQRLTQTHRAGLLALGIFPGLAVSVDQFAAIAALPAVQARSTLRSLAARNLIKPTRDPVGHLRYEMHDLMRDFARQQAASHMSTEERAAGLARLTRWYTTVVDAHESLWNRATEPRRSIWDASNLSELDESHVWLATEQGNLRAFASVVATEEAAHICFRFGKLLVEVGRMFYLLESDWTARELQYAACNIYHRTANRAGEASALLELGALTIATPNAGDYYRRALTIYQQTGNRAGEAAALVALGRYETTIDDELARDYYRRAVTIYQQTGNRTGEAAALLDLCKIPSHAGDTAAAEELRQALTIYERAGDLGGQARTLHRLGGAASDAGNYAVASEYLHRALSIDRQAGDWRSEAVILRDLGDVAIVQGRRDEANSYYQRAHAVYVESSDPDNSLDAAQARTIQEDIDRINTGNLPLSLLGRLLG